MHISIEYDVKTICIQLNINSCTITLYICTDINNVHVSSNLGEHGVYPISDFTVEII